MGTGAALPPGTTDVNLSHSYSLFCFFLKHPHYSYNLLFLILTYIFPLMTMGIAYTLMARVLWGSKQIGESTQAQMNLICSKQKVVRMLICGKYFLLKHVFYFKKCIKGLTFKKKILNIQPSFRSRLHHIFK